MLIHKEIHKERVVLTRDEKTGKPTSTKMVEEERLPHIENLSCGHQNNLLLPGRVSGKCPKGDVVDKHGNRIP